MQPSCMVHTAPSVKVVSMLSRSLPAAGAEVAGAAVAVPVAASVCGITGCISSLPCFSTVNCTACVAACVRR